MEGKTSGGHAVLENHQDSLRQAADWGKPLSSAEEPRLDYVRWAGETLERAITTWQGPAGRPSQSWLAGRRGIVNSLFTPCTESCYKCWDFQFDCKFIIHHRSAPFKHNMLALSALSYCGKKWASLKLCFPSHVLTKAVQLNGPHLILPGKLWNSVQKSALSQFWKLDCFKVRIGVAQLKLSAGYPRPGTKNPKMRSFGVKLLSD